MSISRLIAFDFKLARVDFYLVRAELRSLLASNESYGINNRGVISIGAGFFPNVRLKSLVGDSCYPFNPETNLCPGVLGSFTVYESFLRVEDR